MKRNLPDEIIELICIHSNDLVVAWILKCRPHILDEIAKNIAKYGHGQNEQNEL